MRRAPNMYNLSIKARALSLLRTTTTRKYCSQSEPPKAFPHYPSSLPPTPSSKTIMCSAAIAHLLDLCGRIIPHHHIPSVDIEAQAHCAEEPVDIDTKAPASMSSPSVTLCAATTQAETDVEVPAPVPAPTRVASPSLPVVTSKLPLMTRAMGRPLRVQFLSSWGSFFPYLWLCGWTYLFHSRVVLDLWEQALPEEEMEKLKAQLRREELKYIIHCIRMGTSAFVIFSVIFRLPSSGLLPWRFILLSFLGQVLVSKTVNSSPTQ
ncbi:hypothetical protein A0H81_02520 [Grifola frondosa]|uniref:Uncharacterized protein n=1 Tax=Grifola frondosa TaxID=5627 RepID=A0A1C7MN35_GRIFR|nr:hypothetical protein A0H81_02520 [Grifola frondosa]